MKSSTGIILLVAGLAIGGSAVWYFTAKTTGPEKAGVNETVKTQRNILFYRNPMNPEVTSSVPMKDQMGMDYVPVYEDEAPQDGGGAPGSIRLSPERVQRSGVRSEEVKRMALKRVIRTVGRVEPVEDRVSIVNTKLAGWVEILYINRTDETVRKGQKLFELYSPELIAAQEEYLLAVRSLDGLKNTSYAEAAERAGALVESAKKRLRYWDISNDQIEEIRKTGKTSRTLAIMAPSDGAVTEKMVVEGQKVEAGEPLFRIIDHSRVWVYGEIYEYEMDYVKKGQEALLSPAYSPAQTYKGRIDHIYSHLGSIRYAEDGGTEVRTAKVRFELPNTDHRLKLGMYLNVEIDSVVNKRALAVPDSAVIDTGTRQVAIVDNRDGTFTPATIKTGARAEGFYEVHSGLEEGQWVVTAANFLIDSESNLKAAVFALAGDGKATPAKKEETKQKTGATGGPGAHIH